MSEFDGGQASKKSYLLLILPIGGGKKEKDKNGNHRAHFRGKGGNKKEKGHCPYLCKIEEGEKTIKIAGAMKDATGKVKWDSRCLLI